MTEEKPKPKPDEKPVEGKPEDLSPPSEIPSTEQKAKPPEHRVEIITKEQKEEGSERDVKIYKYIACPYCDNPDIYYDSTRNVYYCGRCKTAWQ